MSVTVKKTGPGIAGLQHSLQELQRADVLVGIPASTTQRKGDPITNASLMFIHSKGSVLQHIPKRPTIEPAIEDKDNQAVYMPHLEAAAIAVLDHDPVKAQRELQLAGTIAANAAKRRFSKTYLTPNAPATIKRKDSDTPLVNFGHLRRAIVSVVRIKP